MLLAYNCCTFYERIFLDIYKDIMVKVPYTTHHIFIQRSPQNRYIYHFQYYRFNNSGPSIMFYQYEAFQTDMQ